MPFSSVSTTKRNSVSPRRCSATSKSRMAQRETHPGIPEFLQGSKIRRHRRPALFAVGDFVDAIGITKGRGFEGVVKRHHFAGGTRRTCQGCTPQRRHWPATVPWHGHARDENAGHMDRLSARHKIWKSSRCARRTICCSSKARFPGGSDYVIIRESKKRQGLEPPVSWRR